jgi:hypothetical protein
MTTRVTLNLTDQDLANVERIVSLPGVRNRTHAMSVALALTAYLASVVQRGGELLTRKKDGTVEKVVLMELQTGQPVPAGFEEAVR